MKGLNAIKIIFRIVIFAFTIAAILSVSGVFSAWSYAGGTVSSSAANFFLSSGTFDYSNTQEGTDEENITAINRLLQVLNNDIEIPGGVMVIDDRTFSTANVILPLMFYLP